MKSRISSSLWFLGLSLLVACFAVPAASPPDALATEEGADFNILVTNDDGVYSEGIAVLAGALSSVGNVFVVAPLENHSGASHSLGLMSGQVRTYPVIRNDAHFGHGVKGTPVDSVLVAMYGLHPEIEFDLVVSGINNGTNAGLGSHYSGTVGAAMEGLIQGVPAIAVSQANDRADGYVLAARFTARVAERVRDSGLPSRVLLSINVPAGELAGVVARPMGGSLLKDFQLIPSIDHDGAPYLQLHAAFETEFPKGSDNEAYSEHFLTITPIQVDWTAHEMLEDLNGWDLSID